MRVLASSWPIDRVFDIDSSFFPKGVIEGGSISVIYENKVVSVVRPIITDQYKGRLLSENQDPDGRGFWLYISNFGFYVLCESQAKITPQEIVPAIKPRHRFVEKKLSKLLNILCESQAKITPQKTAPAIKPRHRFVEKKSSKLVNIAGLVFYFLSIFLFFFVEKAQSIKRKIKKKLISMI